MGKPNTLSCPSHRAIDWPEHSMMDKATQGASFIIKRHTSMVCGLWWQPCNTFISCMHLVHLALYCQGL